MNRYMIPFLFLFFIACSDKSYNEQVAELNKSDLKKSALEGHWKFVTAVEVKELPFLSQYNTAQTPTRVQDPEAPITEALFKRPDLHLIFENDTMYEVQYPTSLDRQHPYSVNSGYVHWGVEHYPIQLVNDTLFLYKSFDGAYLKEVYVKTSLDDSLVDLLKKHGANYPELAGTWMLIRESGGDGEGTYLLEFPYEIPDSIEISREDFISAVENNKVYMMSTDGKKRDYTFSYEWGYLRFTPGKWYKGEDPWIHFTRKQMDN